MNPRTPYLLVGPLVLLFVLLFIGSAAYFFAMSFWKVQMFRAVPDFSFANYAKVFTTHLPTALLTLGIGLAVGLTTTLLGFFCGWLIRFRLGVWGPPLLFITLVTLFGGYLMKIYAWKTILGSDGVINSLLINLGIVDQPVRVLLYSPVAVVITLSHFLLPFAILPIYGSLRGIADAEIEAARDLGAGPWAILRDIIVPQARVGLIAGFALSFLICIGDYITPRLVGGTISMFGQLIQAQFGSITNWPLGAAMSYSILFMGFAVVAVFAALVGRIGRP